MGFFLLICMLMVSTFVTGMDCLEGLLIPVRHCVDTFVTNAQTEHQGFGGFSLQLYEIKGK